jgi:protein-S-isoprenylcysteine O-methyltransferase Ste14
MMETARYVIAVGLLVLSPWLLFWFPIHPFASFWRRVGPVWTYVLVGSPLVGLGLALYTVRDALLDVEYGTHYALIAVGLVCMIAAIVLRRVIHRQLTPRMLSGAPELSADDPGVLLTEGLYARMRHPRYAQVTLAMLGWALVANYLAVYIIVLLVVPGLYLTALLEERELTERFGDAYRDYARRVPRFFPRLGRI